MLKKKDNNKKGLWESHAGTFQISIVAQTMVCLSLDGNSDMARENIGPISKD